jgi:hypothetical protein
MASLNMFLVMMGLFSDLAFRSVNTTRWATALAVLGIIFTMASVRISKFLQVFDSLTLKPQLPLHILMQLPIIIRIQSSREELEGPKVKVIRDGIRQNIYPGV